MEFIISQILGVVSCILLCISYFYRKKAAFLLYQLASDLFCGLSFICLRVLSAGIITLISILKCIYLYFCEKTNFKYKYYFLSIFMVAYVVVVWLTWQSPLDIIPLITVTLFTFSFCIKDMQVMRYVILLPSVILFVYCILCGTYTNALLETIEISSIIIAIIKFNRENKKLKNKNLIDEINRE